MQDKKYNAFISYSHKEDISLGKSIQKSIQQLGKPWNKIRGLKVFRDQTNLSASPQLWNNIKNALKESDYFILLASPEAADSKWVKRELTFWLENKGVTNLIIILTKGNITWDNNQNDFDWTATTSLPKMKYKAFTDEPLYIDFKETKNEANQSLRNPFFKEKIAVIVATIKKMEVADVISEEVTQYKKVIILRNSAITVLCLLLLTASFAAFYAFLQKEEVKVKNMQLTTQIQETNRQRDTAKEEKKMNELSFENLKLEKVDPTKAFRFAQYFNLKFGHKTKNFAEIIKGIYKGNFNFYSMAINIEEKANSIYVSEHNGNILVGNKNGTFTLLNPQGKVINNKKVTSDTILHLAFIGNYIIGGDSRMLKLYDNKGNEIKKVFDGKGLIDGIGEIKIRGNNYIQLGAFFNDNRFEIKLYKLNQLLQLNEVKNFPVDTSWKTDYFQCDISANNHLIVKGIDQIGEVHGWVRNSSDASEGKISTKNSNLFDFFVLKPEKYNYKDYQGEFEGGTHFYDVSIAPNGYLIIGSLSDRTTRIWETSGQELGVIYGNFYKVKFLNDDQVLALDYDDKLYLFNTAGVKLSQFLGPGRIHDFCVTGGIVYTLGDSQVHKWEVFNNKLIDIDVRNKGLVRIQNVLYNTKSRSLIIDCVGSLWEQGFHDFKKFPVMKSEFNFTSELKQTKAVGIQQMYGFKKTLLTSSTGLYKLKVNESGSIDLYDSSGASIITFQGRTGLIGSIGFFANDHYFYFVGESGSLEIYYTPVGILNSKKMANFNFTY
ncbi:TIR domain-containing protein [Arcicella sp. DC2W]|uniref:TIR domain-containing protein n=1 Tax=Arcicella gelida TaxID=2984195 RepID=A0ABU5SAT2_9BACT|nr:TIR domain-containing protein [Arcicella sp. DC2W]MEA5405583.1 TIR domain-containing protein [Arcicella sp. DC2W]